MKVLLKPAFIIAIVAVIFVTGIGLFINVSAEENLIPSWVKNVAGFWANDDVSEKEFMGAIEYLIDTGVVNVPEIANLKMENAELQKRNDAQVEGIGDLIDERAKLISDNIVLKATNDELFAALEKSQVLILEYLELYESGEQLSGQSVPDTLWGYVNAEYYDNRYDRINVKIHTTDKYENDFVFKQGRVDVLVWFELEYGVSPNQQMQNNQGHTDLGNKGVVVIEQTVKFSESDYSYDNKLVFDVEDCLPAGDYFLRATIWSDMGNSFTLNDVELTVSEGSC